MGGGAETRSIPAHYPRAIWMGGAVRLASVMVWNCGLESAGMSVRRGRSANWMTTAPRGVTIDQVSATLRRSRAIGDGHGWTGQFFWHRGHVLITRRYNRRGCCNRHFKSQSFGWRMTCVASSCHHPASLDVGAIELLATEHRRPAVTPAGGINLWYHAGRWVRGIWPVRLSAQDPSGICALGVKLGSYAVPGPVDRRNTDRWRQCPERSWSTLVNTASAQGARGTEGPMTLRMSAVNAARLSASRSETVYVDNTRPWVKISGPSDARSTAGTQHVTATAGGSPSGIAGIKLPGRPPCGTLVSRFVGQGCRVGDWTPHDRVYSPESRD